MTITVSKYPIYLEFSSPASRGFCKTDYRLYIQIILEENVYTGGRSNTYIQEVEAVYTGGKSSIYWRHNLEVGASLYCRLERFRLEFETFIMELGALHRYWRMEYFIMKVGARRYTMEAQYVHLRFKVQYFKYLRLKVQYGIFSDWRYSIYLQVYI